MIDYAEIDSAVGQNWYDLDPELQARVEADCPTDDLEWANGTLRRFGALVGGRVVGAVVVDAVVGAAVVGPVPPDGAA